MGLKSSQKLNLNNISEEKLATLLSISPRLAKRIIAFRPITSLYQVDQIWGIDTATKQKIADLFDFNPEITQESIEPIEELQEIEHVPNQIEPTDFPQGSPIHQEQKEKKPKSRPSWKTVSLLFIIFLVGALFRFQGLNWDNNFHQHPDERYMSMVAESIKGVDSIRAYFDTQVSTLNPLKHGSYTYGMLPLFITRMVAEWLDMTHYNSITLVGRALSGVFDLAAILSLFLLAVRLYNKKIAFLATALYAITVFPIQLSHFFTVDSFATFFVVTSFYFLLLAIPIDQPDQKVSDSNFIFFILFGSMVGMAGACKVNTLPVFGLIVISGAIYLFLNRQQSQFWKFIKLMLFGLFLSALFAFLAFRIFQPYAFNGPGISNVSINENWLKVIKEVTNQVAGNSEWPPNHHWTNRPVQYAWVNMVLWGMGPPLGLMAWFGWGWAGYRIWKGEWRKHLFPFIWILAYFIWQNIQFWRYMRYFLPIYPFLILFAAWALHELIYKTNPQVIRIREIGRNFGLQVRAFKHNWQGLVSIVVLMSVILGTLGYAFAFTRIYSRPHTRVEASRWILENIPGPLNVFVSSDDEIQMYPIPVYNNQKIVSGEPQIMDLRLKSGGSIARITAPNISQPQRTLRVTLAKDESEEELLVDVVVPVPFSRDPETLFVEFPEIELEPNQSYYLNYFPDDNLNTDFSQTKVSLNNEDDASFIIENKNLLDEVESFSIRNVFDVDESVRLNRLEIMDFTQEFQPSTVVLKVSILKDRDEQNPLVEAERIIELSEPGERYSTEFTFPIITLEEETSYQVKYELIEGKAALLRSEVFALETSWDDALPLAVDDTDALGGIYKPLNLELYEADTPEKRDRMIDILDASEYLVIPSNRAYDAMPRLELRYPLTLRYYQLLFDCECSSDAMEKRAYGLEPPFKSPLGFDLVAIFVSHPNLGPIQINDQNADESFTVYDHPKVFIFKKSDDFSIEKIREEFNQVDLDTVIFQVPKDYSRANTALQLPPERLKAQKNGGTWSQIFNQSSLLNENQTMSVLSWYLLLWIIGLIVFPVVFCVFSILPDKGYSLIRMAGLLMLAWLPWFFASIKVISFTRISILIGIFVLVLLNGFLFLKKRQEIVDYLKQSWRHVLFIELIFLVLFIFSLLVRINNPDLWHPWLGGEKPMDFAFFNAVLKSVYFPPANPWFSDHYINYYYYGFVVASIPTKLLGIIPSIAYNLVLPSWFAMTGIGVLGLSFNIYKSFKNNHHNPELDQDGQNKTIRTRFQNIFTSSSAAYLIGIMAVVAILFMGNFYQMKMLWKYLPEVSNLSVDAGTYSNFDLVLSGASQVLSGNAELPGDAGRWYFSASRPILHDGPDTPIVEFPFFSFLYADMHPHLLSMPFFALGLAWCLSVYLTPIQKRKWQDQILTLVLFGLFVGSFLASHTWDYPLFLALAVFIMVWKIFIEKQFNLKKMIKHIFLYASGAIGISLLLYRPFSLWFKTDYSSIEFWKGAKTPLIDYWVVLGFSLFVMVSLLFINILPDMKRWFSDWKEEKSKRIYLIPAGVQAIMIVLWAYNYQVLAFGLPLLIFWIYLIFFKKDISEFHRLIFFLFTLGYSLTFITEIFVLKGDVGRSNMVFRIYLQAWIILGIAISLGLIELLKIIRSWRRGVRISWIISLQVLILFGLSYPLIATKYKINDRWPDVENPPKTLDGALFMLGDSLYNPEFPPAYYSDEDRKLNLAIDYFGIRYMQDQVVGSPVIVEGHTTEYRWGARYSIYTGLPSVIGWNWHTRQHHSLLGGEIVEKRIQQVNEFYDSDDIEKAIKFLKRYDVGYIIVSDLERVYYSSTGLEKFNEMTRRGDLRIVHGDLSGNTAVIYEVVR